MVETINEIEEMFKYLNTGDIIGFDTETTSLSYKKLELVGMSFYTRDKGFYVNIPETSVKEDIIKCLRNNINDLFSQKKIVAHNWSYDGKVLRKYNIDMPKDFEDTILMAHLINENKPIGLKKLAVEYLGVKEAVAFKDIVKGDIREADIEELEKYAIKDAQWTYELYEKLNPLLDIEDVRKVYERIEKPLISVLIDMEINGVLIDKKYLANMDKRVDFELEKAKKLIYKKVGREFNLNSPQQLGSVLYEDLKLPVLETTPKGKPSTAEKTLQRLAKEGFFMAEQLLKYRQLSKLSNTYIKKLPLFADEDGRIRTSFNSVGTKTGRFSSSNPNLQNQPTDSEWQLRKAFIAEEGYDMLCADYSQIELRIIAHICKDEKMQKMFRSGEDIHQLTADEMGIPRKDAKAANFAYAYGGWGEYKDKYFEHFPKIKKWQKRQEQFVAKYGFVRTITRRKRRLEKPTRDMDWKKKSFLHRLSYNSAVQGSGGDIMKLALISVNEKIKKYGGRLLLTVHDEVVIESPKKNTKKMVEVITEAMCNVLRLSVPLTISINVADNWYDAK